MLEIFDPKYPGAALRSTAQGKYHLRCCIAVSFLAKVRVGHSHRPAPARAYDGASISSMKHENDVEPAIWSK